MNLRNEILKEHSKSNTIFLAEWIGEDTQKFAEFMDLFLHEGKRVTQLSAWILSYCIEAHPQLIQPYWLDIIHACKNPSHPAVRRNIVRILQFVEIPEDYIGEIYNMCLQYVQSPKEEIGVRAFSISAVTKIAQQFPDLISEVQYILQDIPNDTSPGIQSRIKKAQKELGLFMK